MNTGKNLVLIIALYVVFSFILTRIWNVPISFFIAGILASLVGWMLVGRAKR